jgi:cell division protein FtsQ
VNVNVSANVKRDRKARLPILGVLLVLSTVGGVGYGATWLITHARHFAVRAIKFPPLQHVSDAELQARAGLAVGVNLFAVDLSEIERKVLEEPWVKEAHARRELPSTIAVDVSEREAACVVALGALYLADARGVVFKRANPDEAVGLPVVTGIERDAYLGEPEATRAHVREALEVAGAWSASSARPALGELHWDRTLGITVYTREGAVGVRLGRGETTVQRSARLRNFDIVWTALAERGEKPRMIYLDNRARPDRVTVKLTAPATPDDGRKSET